MRCSTCEHKVSILGKYGYYTGCQISEDSECIEPSKHDRRYGCHHWKMSAAIKKQIYEEWEQKRKV